MMRHLYTHQQIHLLRIVALFNPCHTPFAETSVIAPATTANTSTY
jgi:hypothetical protein